jgi:serine/threonine protein phosphatase 1
MKNYWFIGDIHGEIGLLNRLLEHILGWNPERIVFVGDYIDRGPHAREVVDRIRNLELPVSCLMGNHELMLLNAIEDLGYGLNPIELWYYNGGEATLQSFGSSSFFSFQSDLDPSYLDFFRSLKMSEVIRLGAAGDVLVSHAGISPFIPVKDQFAMRGYQHLKHYLIENHIDPGDSFLWVREAFFNSSPSLWKGYLVIHGHTPVLKLKRFILANGHNDYHFVENDLCLRKDRSSGHMLSVDIDSGSAISGRLSGLGLFQEKTDSGTLQIRMRSMTVSREEIFPRDLGIVTFGV